VLHAEGQRFFAECASTATATLNLAPDSGRTAKGRLGFLGRHPQHVNEPEGLGLGGKEVERAARFLKGELKKADMTVEDLVKRMKKHGFDETKI
jgi:hypothetical protein